MRNNGTHGAVSFHYNNTYIRAIIMLATLPVRVVEDPISITAGRGRK